MSLLHIRPCLKSLLSVCFGLTLLLAPHAGLAGQPSLHIQFTGILGNPCYTKGPSLLIGAYYNVMITLLPNGDQDAMVDYEGVTDWSWPEGLTISVGQGSRPGGPFHPSTDLRSQIQFSYFVSPQEAYDDSLWHVHGKPPRKAPPPHYIFSFLVPPELAGSYLCASAEWNHPQYGHLMTPRLACIKVIEPCNEQARRQIKLQQFFGELDSKHYDVAESMAVSMNIKSTYDQMRAQAPWENHYRLELQLDSPLSSCTEAESTSYAAIAGSLANLRVLIKPAYRFHNLDPYRGITDWAWPPDLTIEAGRVGNDKLFIKLDSLLCALDIHCFLTEDQRKWDRERKKGGKAPGGDLRFPQSNFQFRIPETMPGRKFRVQVSLNSTVYGKLEAAADIEVFAPCTKLDVEQMRDSHVELAFISAAYEYALECADSLIPLGWRSKMGLILAACSAQRLQLKETVRRYTDLCLETFGDPDMHDGPTDSSEAQEFYRRFPDAIRFLTTSDRRTKLAGQSTQEDSPEVISVRDLLQSAGIIDQIHIRKLDCLYLNVSGLMRPKSPADSPLDLVYQFLEEYRPVFGLADPRSEIVFQRDPANSIYRDSSESVAHFERPMMHYHFVQEYCGLPVLNTSLDVDVWRDDLAISSIKAAILPNIELNCVPAISEAEAIQRSYDCWLNHFVQPGSIEKATLCIMWHDGSPRLTWLMKMSYSPDRDHHPTQPIWVDAQTGETREWQEPPSIE